MLQGVIGVKILEKINLEVKIVEKYNSINSFNI